MKLSKFAAVAGSLNEFRHRCFWWHFSHVSWKHLHYDPLICSNLHCWFDIATEIKFVFFLFLSRDVINLRRRRHVLHSREKGSVMEGFNSIMTQNMTRCLAQWRQTLSAKPAIMNECARKRTAKENERNHAVQSFPFFDGKNYLLWYNS